MAVNKVEYAGMVLLDLTGDTISPDTVLAGYTGHDKSGQAFMGTLGTDKFVSGTFTQKSTDLLEIDTGLDHIKGLIVFSSNNTKTNTCGFAYVEGITADAFCYNKSGYIDPFYHKEDGSSYITIENGKFSGTKYGDGSYPFIAYSSFSWVAWGDGDSESLDDRDVYVSGSAYTTDSTDTLEIDTGLDQIEGFIVLSNDQKSKGIKACIYSSILQGQMVEETAITIYLYIDTGLFSVNNGKITISEKKSNYGFISNTAYNWVAWGDGTVKVGSSSSSSGDSTPTLQSKSVTPSEAQQTVSPDSGYDGLSQVTVGAIDKTYIGSEVTKKSAQTYTPGTANQTIASGQYLNGVQTILGDSDLIASNIKKGVSIFNVTGTYEAASSGGSSSNNCEAYLVDVTDPTVSFKRTDGTLKAWGYAYVTTSSGWTTTTTVYAFAGDKYYKSATYGSPTSTSLTLGESGGKLTGLPTLTGGELLITKGI